MEPNSPACYSWRLEIRLLLALCLSEKIMNTFEFEQLCRDASHELGVEDTGALGQGFTMPYADVLFETAFRDGRQGFVLMAELGAVEAQNKLGVYENLLTVQLLTANQPGMRFGFNPTRQTVMVCVRAALGAQSSGSWLAALVRALATQVVEWRGTLLANKVGEPEPGQDIGPKPLQELVVEHLAQRL